MRSKNQRAVSMLPFRRAGKRRHDPHAAAQQDRVKADHDAIQESARRVDASVAGTGGVSEDARAAAQQDRVRDDTEALQESARRVDASVSSDVRNTPIQQPDNQQDRRR